MLIHPRDAAHDDGEWRDWLADHDFGQLAVNGLPGEPPHIQPTHFTYDPEPGAHGVALTHLARPNPLWPALLANPRVTLAVTDDYAFVPAAWQAPDDDLATEAVPTSFYAAVQLLCVAHIVDDPREKTELLRAQLAHFEPAGDHARTAPGEEPYARLLPGIRGLRLEVTEVRAKFKYGGNKPDAVRRRAAEGLLRRGAPRDAAAHAHHTRRAPVPGPGPDPGL